MSTTYGFGDGFGYGGRRLGGGPASDVVTSPTARVLEEHAETAMVVPEEALVLIPDAAAVPDSVARPRHRRVRTARRGAARPSGPVSTSRRTAGAAWTFAMSALFGIVAGIALLFLASIPAGYREMTVMSGSMEPTLDVGDVVLERHASPTDVRIGDIVTFRDPDDDSVLITHRIRSIRIHDGVADVITKGDANNTVERWSIPTSGTVGVVRADVPRVGFALAWAATRTGRIALVAIPGVLLGLLELMRIWRPRRDEEP